MDVITSLPPSTHVISALLQHRHSSFHISTDSTWDLSKWVLSEPSWQMIVQWSPRPRVHRGWRQVVFKLYIYIYIYIYRDVVAEWQWRQAWSSFDRQFDPYRSLLAPRCVQSVPSFSWWMKLNPLYIRTVFLFCLVTKLLNHGMLFNAPSVQRTRESSVSAEENMPDSVWTLFLLLGCWLKPVDGHRLDFPTCFRLNQHPYFRIALPVLKHLPKVDRLEIRQSRKCRW